MLRVNVMNAPLVLVSLELSLWFMWFVWFVWFINKTFFRNVLLNSNSDYDLVVTYE